MQMDRNLSAGYNTEEKFEGLNITRHKYATTGKAKEKMRKKPKCVLLFSHFV